MELGMTETLREHPWAGTLGRADAVSRLGHQSQLRLLETRDKERGPCRWCPGGSSSVLTLKCEMLLSVLFCFLFVTSRLE